MIRIATALLLLVATCTLITAQRKPEPTLHAELRDRRWVSLKDMLRLYGQARGIVILYNEQKLAGNCDWVSNDREMTGTQIDLFVANALEPFRLVLMHRGGNQYAIIPEAEAETFAPLLTRAELEAANPATWAAVTVQCKNFYWQRLRAGWTNLTMREAHQLPYLHDGAVLCDRVDRLRNWLKLLDELDAGAVREVRAYELPEGVGAVAAVRVLRELFSAGQTFTVSPGGAKVLCRARAEQHVHVAESIAALE
jgi:hypothetical protein